MSVETSQKIMDGYAEALLSGGDFGRYLTEDVVWTTMETGDEVRGREAVSDLIVALHTTTFRANPRLRNLVVSDGIAVFEGVFVGTHTGEFAGLPATGRSVELPYTVVYDVTEDGIAALRAYLSVAALRERLTA